MAASSRAVPPIWASAARAVQPSMAALSAGGAWPVTATTSARKSPPNGRPNRKRTCVAPTVPSVAVSSFCMALRSVCPPAAAIVNTTQSQLLNGALDAAGAANHRGLANSLPCGQRDGNEGNLPLERPHAIGLPAGNALCLARVAAGGQHHHDVAADPI